MLNHRKNITFVVIVVFTWVCFSPSAYSQLYNYISSGGDKILDVNNYPPVDKGPLDSTSNSKFSESGSISIICDSSGQMVLTAFWYSYYNKYKQRINSYSFIPKNGRSLFRTGILLPSKKAGIYYYFYVALWSPPEHSGGMAYTVVDVNADSGKGAIIDTSFFYYRDTSVFYKMMALPGSHQGEFWLFAQHFENMKLYTWRFDGENVTGPVISDNVYPDSFKFSGHESDFCYSVTTKTLFLVHRAPQVDSIVLKLFSFNPKTGELTHKATYNLKELELAKNNDYKYLLYTEVTEYDTVLYVAFTYSMLTDSAILMQIGFDKNMQINKVVEMPLKFAILGMRYVSTGQLYVLQRIRPKPFMFKSFLAVIQNPEKFGPACNLREEIFTLKDNSYSLSNIVHENMKVRFKTVSTCRDTVLFYNQSDSAKYSHFTWYIFPGGDSMEGFHASHVLPKSGIYIIKLKAETPAGYVQWGTDTLKYIKRPQTEFSTDTTIGCRWLKFRLHDVTVNDTVNKSVGESWLWDFGDGSTDTVKTPEHIYTKTGKYDIRLIYSNGFCTDTFSQSQAVEIIDAPRPGFALSSSSYCSPFTLSIQDTSQGQVSNYHYDFGDGSTSTLASPSHYYPVAGNYKIIQTLTGPTGCVTSDSAGLHLRPGFDGTEPINSLTANVWNDHAIEISWRRHNSATSYVVDRSRNDTDYSQLAQTPDTVFSDITARPDKEVYLYRVKGKDSCGRSSLPGLKLKNILLTGQSFGNDYCVLQWTAFEQWQNGVREYQLLMVDSTGEQSLIISTSKRTYRDDNYFSGESPYRKCYRIRAVENGGNLQASVSNLQCLPYETILWVPNTFSPNNDGLNDVFRVAGISIKSISLYVFNRWGQQVFEGHDKNEGWPGTYKDKPVEQGVYYYHVIFTSGSGKNGSYSGTVHLIR